MTAQHRPLALTRADLAHLLSGRSDAQGVGALVWRLAAGNAYIGELPVDVSIDQSDKARLKIGVNYDRPDFITLVYLVNDVPPTRICINGSHRGIPRGTHRHQYQPDGSEKTWPTPDFSPVPPGPTVASGTWRRVFEDFASLVNVKLPVGYWTDPKGGAA